jgi:hypothetical protein
LSANVSVLARARILLRKTPARKWFEMFSFVVMASADHIAGFMPLAAMARPELDCSATP